MCAFVCVCARRPRHGHHQDGCRAGLEPRSPPPRGAVPAQGDSGSSVPAQPPVAPPGNAQVTHPASEPGQAAQDRAAGAPPSPPLECHHPATASVRPSVHPRVASRGRALMQPSVPGRSWQQDRREEAEEEAAPAQFTRGCQADAAQAPLSPRRHKSRQPEVGADGRGELLSTSRRVERPPHAPGRREARRPASDRQDGSPERASTWGSR